ncbi:MAG TPA: hypothetical protein VNY31_04845 [Solirubrobacteraceae bacterium]|nr:hypothetical protein [Solirubrobacteraceae bacterium]
MSSSIDQCHRPRSGSPRLATRAVGVTAARERHVSRGILELERELTKSSRNS